MNPLLLKRMYNPILTILSRGRVVYPVIPDRPYLFFMEYLFWSNLFFSIMCGILLLLTIHFIFFAVVGLFKRKTFPKTEKKLRYGLIIPARNEEAVVGNLIESIQKSNYPQDKLQIFLIAHNCTDRTAEIGRALGATVYEYNNENERTMGYAFRYLFDRIREDYGTENYDGFFLFNADNIVDAEYFNKMNDAFVAGDKKCVVTSFRNSKNFGSNILAAMYGMYFVYGCRMESRGRTYLGCSTRVQGTGYVISSDLVKDGWKYVTLTEDWEFTADQILADTPIVFCDEAVFYDEQPTSLKVMWRQRLRWSKGHLIVCVTRLKALLKGLFTPASKGGTRRKFSTYDISVNILPVCVMMIFIWAFQFLSLFLAPVFGVSLQETLVGYIRTQFPIFLMSNSALIIASVILLFVERKRIPKFAFWKKALAVLLWPLFLMVSFPAEFVALFTKKVGWAPIPHTDTTSFKELNPQADSEKNSDSSSCEERAN